jgi:hypothetical protein
MNKKILILLSIFVYVTGFIATYRVFAKEGLSNIIGSDSNYKVPVTNTVNGEDLEPKTEECPLNGKLYSKKQRSLWEDRRPLGIMVQNNLEARPQSGLSSADIIHEAVAEGGITRFLVMYYCDNPKVVGSVRSARVYYITLLQGFGNYPLYAHVGGANTPGPADALGMIKKLKWFGYNDMDQFSVPFPQYWRDYDRLPGRATEHTVYTNTTKLWEFAKNKRELADVDDEGVEWDSNWKPWLFKDGSVTTKEKKVAKISYGFWENNIGSDYVVDWDFDSVTNMYKRTNGGVPHMDNNNDKQLSASNVIVVFSDESVANDGYEGGQHMLYDLLGTGEALIFQNGEVVKTSWRKQKATDMIRFYDSRNREVEMVRGLIWISILPSDNEVTY